ncbi:hypothetical protein POTOM_055829 [Populus tomentosa]|uniref:Uncharacterized protein n=1 Tax=Populus tomentosa TaxID=118781 RepID=A0A8X7Y7B6_POPTO|nr:hypothetical protein POTOM_055829 [Populus tomentosa]
MVGTWHLAADDTDKVTGFEEELQNARASVETPTTTLENLNQTKADVLNNLEKESAMKDLELQESVLQSDYDVKRTDLETEVCELEEKIAAGMESESLSKDLDCLLRVIGKTECGKQVMLVRRKLGEVPSPPELIQYFQDAITNTDGCTRLIDSMEGNVKGSQLVIYKEQTVAVEWFSGGRLGFATTRVRVLVLRIATKYNSEFSLSASLW